MEAGRWQRTIDHGNLDCLRTIEEIEDGLTHFRTIEEDKEATRDFWQ